MDIIKIQDMHIEGHLSIGVTNNLFIAMGILLQDSLINDYFDEVIIDSIYKFSIIKKYSKDTLDPHPEPPKEIMRTFNNCKFCIELKAQYKDGQDYRFDFVINNNFLSTR